MSARSSWSQAAAKFADGPGPGRPATAGVDQGLAEDGVGHDQRGGQRLGRRGRTRGSGHGQAAFFGLDDGIGVMRDLGVDPKTFGGG